MGACTAALMPLFDRLRAYVMVTERLHGDDTAVPVLARDKRDIARVWVYLRDDRLFGGGTPSAAIFHYSRDRGGEPPRAHLVGYAGILKADACGGYGKLDEVSRVPCVILEAGCRAHARRKLLVLTDVEAAARRKTQGNSLPWNWRAPDALTQKAA